MGRTLLFLTMGFAAIFGTMEINLYRTNEGSRATVINSQDDLIIRNAAASATNMAISQLYRNFTWRAGYDSVNFAGSNISVILEDNSTDSSLGENQVRVTTLADYGDLHRSIQVIVHKPSFSRYNIFSNVRPSNMYLITGDTLYGPIHTNTKWNMSGYPVFYGKVSSVASTYNTYGTTNPKFYGGTEFGTAPIQFPLVSDLTNYLITAASNGGDLYNLAGKHLWLTFYSDSTYAYQIKSGSTVVGSGTKSLSDINGIIMANDGVLHIKGDVHGRVTVGCTKDIYIEDDIKYAVDPRINPGSNDLLGLVSMKNIIIAYNTPNANNCEIHGSLMALDKGITAQYYNQYSPRGRLIILGGYIVQEEQPTGTFYLSGGLPVVKTGYSKKYYYDERLYAISPPYFPIIQTPEVFSWKE